MIITTQITFKSEADASRNVCSVIPNMAALSALTHHLPVAWFDKAAMEITAASMPANIRCEMFILLTRKEALDTMNSIFTKHTIRDATNPDYLWRLVMKIQAEHRGEILNVAA